MENKQPTWGFDIVDELVNPKYVNSAQSVAHYVSSLRSEFAKYVEEYGEKPVDQKLLIAREVAALQCERQLAADSAAVYRAGKSDDSPRVKVAIEAIEMWEKLEGVAKN